MMNAAASPPVLMPTPTSPSSCSISTSTEGTLATPHELRLSEYFGNGLIGLVIGGWCGGWPWIQWVSAVSCTSLAPPSEPMPSPPARVT